MSSSTLALIGDTFQVEGSDRHNHGSLKYTLSNCRSIRFVPLLLIFVSLMIFAILSYWSGHLFDAS